MATHSGLKHLGAFYTSHPIAQVLVDWAIRSPNDRVLDPACGHGVFLKASAIRLSEIDGEPATQIYGIEIDHTVYEGSLVPLLDELSIPQSNIVTSDFFDVSSSALPQFDTVVGNPPFIRYQTFKGAARQKAIEIARSLGVRLSELASSWAAFLLHATQFLAPGGRLAMVVPAEITHATYARPVVQYLARRFGRIYLAGFKQRLFPDLNEDTFLIFAEGYGGECKELRLKRFAAIEQLASVLESKKGFGTRVGLSRLQDTNGRLRSHFLPSELRGLYTFLTGDARVCRLGELAQVGIGYVTGNNQFFHFSEDEARELRIPKKFLKPSLLRSGIIEGLRFNREDWRELRDRGQKVYLLSLPRVPQSALPKEVVGYLVEGEAHGVHTAYKCAVRHPWFSIPHSGAADAFLTYMSGEGPRLVSNVARVLATNSTHEVRFNNLVVAEAWKAALAFYCSLTLLSAEIEGHPLGGGMLKLEPSEAESTIVIRPELLRVGRDHFEEMDTLVRSGSLGAAIDLGDELVLRDTLGLTWEQIQVLRDGLTEIRETRRKKIASPRSN